MTEIVIDKFECDRYFVSINGGPQYLVDISEEDGGCGCMGYSIYKNCKHYKAVLLAEGVNDDRARRATLHTRSQCR